MLMRLSSHSWVQKLVHVDALLFTQLGTEARLHADALLFTQLGTEARFFTQWSTAARLHVDALLFKQLGTVTFLSFCGIASAFNSLGRGAQ